MTQFYIVEIQQYNDGSFGHIVHWAWDENPDKARLKGESKFYEVLAYAAASDLPMHSAIMFSTEGFPIMNKCYKHPVAPAPVEENYGAESDLSENIEPENVDEPAEEPEAESGEEEPAEEP